MSNTNRREVEVSNEHRELVEEFKNAIALYSAIGVGEKADLHDVVRSMIAAGFTHTDVLAIYQSLRDKGEVYSIDHETIALV